MPEDIRLWEIKEGDKLKEIEKDKLNFEERIEKWLEKDVSILSDDILIIGRQVSTDFGGAIDLLGIDSNGDLVVIELKRDKTPRDITAQTIDYASWITDLSYERITSIANDHLKDNSFEDEFSYKFKIELPDTLNEQHKMLIVASDIDASTERIIKYLSDEYGVSINAITFNYFKDNDKEYLARVFLIDPSEVEYRTGTIGRKRKRNLTLEELLQISTDNGVGELHKTLLAELENLVDSTYTTQSSVGFKGIFGDSRYVIFSIHPEDSSGDKGLQFSTYLNRFMDYFDIDENEVKSIFPDKEKIGEYVLVKDDDKVENYKGYFKNIDEVKRFINSLKECK
jgi:hypothetical protein